MADQYINLTKGNDYDAQLAAFARRQKYAELLAQQGNEDIKVESVNGIPTPISPFQGLANVLKSGMGAYLGGKAEEGAAAATAAERKAVNEERGRIFAMNPAVAATEASQGAYTGDDAEGVPSYAVNAATPGKAASYILPPDEQINAIRALGGRSSLAAKAAELDLPLAIHNLARGEAKTDLDAKNARADRDRNRPVYRPRSEYGGDLVDPNTQEIIESFKSNVRPSASYHTATPEELKGYQPGTTAQYNEVTNKLEEIHEPNQGNRFTISTGKTISDQIVEKGIGLVTDSQSAAQGAVDNTTTNADMIKLLDTNKVIAGPGAKFGLVINQVFGKDPEKLVATRGIIKGLAETTVQARKQFKGQGQISDFETRTLEKAVSGDIDNLTVAEIRAVISANNKMNGIVINRHNNLMAKASEAFKSKDPQDFLKLFQVEEPTQDRRPWGQ